VLVAEVQLELLTAEQENHRVSSGCVMARRRPFARSRMKSGERKLRLRAWGSPLHRATRGPPPPQAGEVRRLRVLCYPTTHLSRT